MFAQNYMKKYNENFPDFLFKLQQTNLQNNYKPYLFIHLPLSPSNIKYLHSLGYDYIHFDPHYPFNFEQMKKIYKLGIMACGSVAHKLVMYQDFYVIYPSELYIKRANNAANTIVTCWKKYYTNKNEFKDCQFSQPSPKKHVIVMTLNPTMNLLISEIIFVLKEIRHNFPFPLVMFQPHPLPILNLPAIQDGEATTLIKIY